MKEKAPEEPLQKAVQRRGEIASHPEIWHIQKRKKLSSESNNRRSQIQCLLRKCHCWNRMIRISTTKDISYNPERKLGTLCEEVAGCYCLCDYRKINDIEDWILKSSSLPLWTVSTFHTAESCNKRELLCYFKINSTQKRIIPLRSKEVLAISI